AWEYAQRAVDRARRSGIESELIKALAELAIVAWRRNERRATFDAISEAISRWFASRNEISDANALFIRLGHASGYFSSLAVRGKLVEGAEYPEPFPGMFLTSDIEGKVAARYDRANDSFIMFHLSEFAEAVGDRDAAYDWAVRAVEDARQTGQHTTILV